jgi:broad specificity phosphatase PhoE
MDQSLDLSEEVKSFYLVRHGELKNSGKGRVPDTNDKGLSSDGVLEAELISSFFHDLRISAIFSSPNNSAVETTDIIAKNIGEPTFLKLTGRLGKKMQSLGKSGVKILLISARLVERALEISFHALDVHSKIFALIMKLVKKLFLVLMQG